MKTLSRSEVAKTINKYLWLLGLGDMWSVGFRINEEKQDEEKGCRHLLGRIQVEAAYYRAYMVLNTYNLSEDESLEEVIAHEMVHIVTDPRRKLLLQAMPDKFENHVISIEESVTERIARALLKLQAQRKRTTRKKKKVSE